MRRLYAMLLFTWLGLLDSNQCIQESKSCALPLGEAPIYTRHIIDYCPTYWTILEIGWLEKWDLNPQHIVKTIIAVYAFINLYRYYIIFFLKNQMSFICISSHIPVIWHFGQVTMRSPSLCFENINSLNSGWNTSPQTGHLYLKLLYISLANHNPRITSSNSHIINGNQIDANKPIIKQ